MSEFNHIDFSGAEKIADYYTLHGQLAKLREESLELAIAATNARDSIDSHKSIDPAARENLIDECADVLIMVYQIAVCFLRCMPEVALRVRYKIERQLRRIEEEGGCDYESN